MPETSALCFQSGPGAGTCKVGHGYQHNFPWGNRKASHDRPTVACTRLRVQIPCMKHLCMNAIIFLVLSAIHRGTA